MSHENNDLSFEIPFRISRNDIIIKLMTREEEQKLVEEAQESLNAFSKLYEFYLPKIFRYVLNRVGNKAVAEDITSQTFLKALKKLNTFDQNKPFGGWLYTIAHNNIIDFYRQNRKYTISIESIEAFLESDKNTEERAKEAEMTKKILDILRGLPNSYQEMLSLRFFEEKSNAEIAELLACTVNNVNVRMHRAVIAFRKYVEKNNSDILELINE